MGDWSELRPSIWNWIDGGSIGWPLQQIIYNIMMCRGGEGYDPPHRAVRNRVKAEYAAAMNFVKREWTILFQFLHGAFGAESNWQLFSGAVVELKQFTSSYCWRDK